MAPISGFGNDNGYALDNYAYNGYQDPASYYRGTLVQSKPSAFETAKDQIVSSAKKVAEKKVIDYAKNAIMGEPDISLSQFGNVGSSAGDFGSIPSSFEFGLGSEASNGFNLAGDVPSSLTNLGEPLSTTPTSGLGAAAPYLGLAGAGLGAYGMYNMFKDRKSMGKGDAAKMGGLAGGALGGGLAAAAPLLGLSLGPVGWALLAGGALGGGLGGLLGGKSTKVRQQEKWSDLANKYGITGDIAGYGDTNKYGVTQDMGVDDRKLASGLLKGKDVWGVSGMFDTFKGDWLGKFTENQREKISDELLANKLLDSRKGLTRVTDDAAAWDIANKVLATPEVKSGQWQPGMPTHQKSYSKKK